jgi:hypothetical protein
MTSESLTCPYCNASIAVTPGLSAGQRIVCPRCGDTFPLRPADSFIAQQPSPTTETAITDRPIATSSPAFSVLDPGLRSRRSLGWMAALVVGFMLLMAGGGLTFMLMTQQQRRAYDTSRPPRRPGKQRGVPEPDNPVVVASIAPDKLAALRYLPSGVNLLLAARIPELQANPIGVKILRDPLKFGDTEYRLQDLPEWVGLRLEDIDHLVFAASIDVLPPSLYLVCRTIQPYDEEQLRQRLKASKVPGGGKNKVYKFRLPRKDISPTVCFADDRTLIVALFEDKPLSLLAQPAEDLQRLPDAVRTMLQERREPVSPVWIAGHSADWTKTIVGNFLGGRKKDDLERLASLRTFAVWLVPDKSLEVKASVQAKDAMAAQRLDDYFRTLHGPDPQFKTALDGPWLTMQLQTEPDFLSRLLKR